MFPQLLTNLNAAFELLYPVGSWVQRAYAIRPDGQVVPPRSEAACSWCLLGALVRVSAPGTYSKTATAVAAYLRKTLGSEIAKGDTTVVHLWNDNPGRTKGEVLELLQDLQNHYS